MLLAIACVLLGIHSDVVIGPHMDTVLLHPRLQATGLQRYPAEVVALSAGNNVSQSQSVRHGPGGDSLNWGEHREPIVWDAQAVEELDVVSILRVGALERLSDLSLTPAVDVIGNRRIAQSESGEFDANQFKLGNEVQGDRTAHGERIACFEGQHSLAADPIHLDQGFMRRCAVVQPSILDDPVETVIRKGHQFGILTNPIIGGNTLGAVFIEVADRDVREADIAKYLGISASTTDHQDGVIQVITQGGANDLLVEVHIVLPCLLESREL